MYPTPVKSLFEITMGNPFLTLCIFRLTTFRSPKLIPKADLKRECPYFYSEFFFEAFWLIFKKVRKWISHCIFKK